MRSILVTGVDGFVGVHLAAAAKRMDCTVVGITREPGLPDTLRTLVDDHRVGDLRSEWPEGEPPDVIIHLAGLAAVGPSFTRPQAYLCANSAMVTTMCEHVLTLPAMDRPRIVGVSSGGVYAPSAEGRAVAEESPIAYSSPYVVSKILVENQLAYYRARGLDTVVARPFNHIGPGQAPGFLVPDLYRSLQDAGQEEPLRTGNLETRRDYTDVRDVVEAYLLLALAPAHAFDVYNVASGHAVSGAEILSILSAEVGVPTPAVQVDRSLVRAQDPDVIVGDSRRIRSELGWSPRRSVKDSLADFVRSSRTNSTLRDVVERRE